MKKAIRFALCASVFVALAMLTTSCATTAGPSVIKPAVGPGTDRPCDYLYENAIVNAHSCGAQPDGIRTCCDDGMQCGGPPPNSCLPGECCPDFTSWFAGASKPVKQRPEAR